ncbi:glycosyltransferase family 2 protein [Calditrichota bacterium]
MTKSEPTVAAVIVTWNSLADIEICIGSLMIQSHHIDKIVVVDNGSTDGTADLVADKFPHVHLISQTENVGFAEGNNIGIAVCASDWILTINPDAYLDSRWVELLLGFAGANTRIGALTGLLYRDSNEDEGSIIDTTGIEIFASRRVRDRGFSEPMSNRYKNAEQVFGACAAAALYRSDMLEDIKVDGEIFPCRFFCYYEDADLAWRSWRRGWECWYVPQALGWHKRGASPVGSKFSRYMTHRNRLWMIARNESILKTIVSQPELFFHGVLMFLRMLRYPYLFKATWEAISGYRQSVHEREQLRSKTEANPPFYKGVGFGK